MLKQNRRSSFCFFLGILFLSSLILCLCLDRLPFQAWKLEIGEAATAQSLDVSQLVQQGVERYQSEDFLGAISRW